MNRHGKAQPIKAAPTLTMKKQTLKPILSFTSQGQMSTGVFTYHADRRIGLALMSMGANSAVSTSCVLPGELLKVRLN